MARQVSGDGFTVYFEDYDTGEIRPLDYATIDTSRHSVIRRGDGEKVGEIFATWGDHNLIRLQASGRITGGILDLARWDMTDAAEAAAARYEIVPPLG